MLSMLCTALVHSKRGRSMRHSDRSTSDRCTGQYRHATLFNQAYVDSPNTGRFDVSDSVTGTSPVTSLFEVPSTSAPDLSPAHVGTQRSLRLLADPSILESKHATEHADVSSR